MKLGTLRVICLYRPPASQHCLRQSKCIPVSSMERSYMHATCDGAVNESQLRNREADYTDALTRSDSSQLHTVKHGLCGL
jgi:hypothetical protein